MGSGKTHQKEMLNLARAAMMERALKKILQMPSDQVVRRISSLQEETLVKEKTKDLVQRQKNRQKLQTNFILKCACCKSFCVHSKDLRVIKDNHHVVIDSEFEGRIEVKPFQKQKNIDGITMTGHMQCKECHRAWGTKFLYQGIPFPSVAIKNFIVVSEETNEIKHCKKWLDLPYTIRVMSQDDFKTCLSTGEDDRSDEEDEDEGEEKPDLK